LRFYSRFAEKWARQRIVAGGYAALDVLSRLVKTPKLHMVTLASFGDGLFAVPVRSLWET